MVSKEITTYIGENHYSSFCERQKEIDDFVNFILWLVGEHERIQSIVHNALVETENDENKRTELLRKWNSRKSTVDELRNYKDLLLEWIIVKHVENYQTYLAHLLREMLKAFPQALGSKEVKLSTVLELGSVDLVIEDTAERAIDRKPLTGLQELFRRFDIEIADPAHLGDIREAIEIRNVIVHNRSLINRRFIKNTQCDASKNSKRVELSIDSVTEFSDSLKHSAESIYKQVKKKQASRKDRY